MFLKDNPLPAWLLCWGILGGFSAPVAAGETGPLDTQLLTYIRCAVDFDMFGKILDGTDEEDKIRLFGEAVMDLEDQSRSFFKNGSDYFAIKAVNLSSSEQVAAIAMKRFESINSGFESDHQAQFNLIVSSGYSCYELLSDELTNMAIEEDGS